VSAKRDIASDASAFVDAALWGLAPDEYSGPEPTPHADACPLPQYDADGMSYDEPPTDRHIWLDIHPVKSYVLCTQGTGQQPVLPPVQFKLKSHAHCGIPPGFQ